MDINDDLWLHIKSFVFPLIDYNKIYQDILYYICQPYIFSDHKNKTFDAQYNFILKQKEIVKNLNEKIKDELIGVTWEPSRFKSWCLSTDEQEELDKRWD